MTPFKFGSLIGKQTVSINDMEWLHKSYKLLHQKQCLKKVEASMTHCPICSLPVSKDEFSAHVEECKRVHRRTKKAGARKGGSSAADGAAAKKPSIVPEHIKRRIESGEEQANTSRRRVYKWTIPTKLLSP